MRVTPLASGSQGNCLLLEDDGVRVLVDVGLEREVVEERLEQVGVRPRSIDYAVLTHRHKDHVRGATEFCSRHRVRVFAVRRTARSLGSEVHKLSQIVVRGEWFRAGPLRVLTIPVEHDAPDTVALLFESSVGVRYGHVTDIGAVTHPVRQTLTECDGLYLEFNYDPKMLWNGPYPAELKRRISSGRGHLSNAQAAALLRELAHPGLRQVWVAHVSRNNNAPELALEHARSVVDAGTTRVSLARQYEITPGVDLAAPRVQSTRRQTIGVDPVEESRQ